MPPPVAPANAATRIPWGIVGFVLMGAALVILALQWQVPRDDSQLSRIAQIAADKSGLLVRGAANQAEVDAGKLVHVWILVQNQSAGDVDGLAIVNFDAPGFTACWVAPAAGACGNPPQPQQMMAKADLTPGQSVLFSGDLTPAANAGRYYLTATFGWRNPQGGDLRNALQIGPVEISSATNRAVVNLGRRVREMVVPIALFVLGAWLQRRDASQKKADDVRALTNARATAVLNSLLTASMRDTQRYYLPLALRTSELLLAIADLKSGAAPGRERSLFALVAFFKRQRWMGENIGGLSFQNRRGEKVAAGLWTIILECVKPHAPKELRLNALRQVALDETAETFRGKLAKDPDSPNTALQEFADKLVEWMDAPLVSLVTVEPLFRIFHDVILFEINRPFEVWYGEPEEFPVQTLADSWSQISKLAPVKAVAERDNNAFGDLWREYLEDAKRWEERRLALGQAATN